MLMGSMTEEQEEHFFPSIEVSQLIWLPLATSVKPSPNCKAAAVLPGAKRHTGAKSRRRRAAKHARCVYITSN